MSNEDDKLAFMSAKSGFGDPHKAFDHALGHAENPDYSVTEIWWWSFHIPERKLSGEIYFWRHTNLKTLSGGVWVYQGVKQHHMQCEHFNWQHFLPDLEFDDQSLYCPQLDLRVNILEPMKQHEIIYRHPESGTRLHLFSQAVQPPVMRSNNTHFEQVAHVTGTLCLNGEDLVIDSMSFRDHSWGDPRPEAVVKHPPTLWGVGVSADGQCSFNFNACDDPRRNPMVAGYGLTTQSALKTGWIAKDGELRSLIGMSKLTERAGDGLRIRAIDAELTDDQGQTYQLSGEILTSVMWSPWPNMCAFFGQLCRWTLDGEVMYGEAQEVFWADCFNKMYTPG